MPARCRGQSTSLRCRTSRYAAIDLAARSSRNECRECGESRRWSSWLDCTPEGFTLQGWRAGQSHLEYTMRLRLQDPIPLPGVAPLDPARTDCRSFSELGRFKG